MDAQPAKPITTVATVVNVKVAHIRPQYDDLKEWAEDPQNIYIGRRGVVFITDKESGIKTLSTRR